MFPDTVTKGIALLSDGQPNVINLIALSTESTFIQYSNPISKTFFVVDLIFS